MEALTPLFLMVRDLEGFERVCFWLAAFVGFVLVGFVLDYLMGRQGFGPYINSILALIGVEVPGKAQRVNISLDEGLLARIDKAAASAGQTRSGFLASAARERIKGME